MAIKPLRFSYGITGATINFRIMRESDGFWRDDVDGVFDAVPTTIDATATEMTAPNSLLGFYYLDIADSPSWSDGYYSILAYAGIKLVGYGRALISNNAEWTDLSMLSAVAALPATIDASDQLLRKTPGSTTNLVEVSDLNTLDFQSDVLTKLDTMLEQDGGVYKYTQNALEEAPQALPGTGDINAGTGDTIVNHNTTDDDGNTLYYQTTLGAGIADADIYAYLQTDYEAGIRNDAAVRGYSMTNTDGSWQWDMHLQSGFTYTIEFSKRGAYSATLATVTI